MTTRVLLSCLDFRYFLFKIDLSQEVVDERTDDLQEMAGMNDLLNYMFTSSIDAIDPLLNSLIPCPLNPSEEVSMPYCICMMILYGAVIYHCGSLLLLAFLLYRLIIFDVNAGTLPNQSRRVCSISPELCKIYIHLTS